MSTNLFTNKNLVFPQTITVFETENDPRGKRVEIESFEQLDNVITGNLWSSLPFENNYRNKANAKETQFIVLDYDGDQGNTLTNEEFAADLRKLGLQFRLYETRNHQKEKHGRVCDRSRAILLATEKMNSQVYENTVRALLKKMPYLDPAPKDISRLWYPSPKLIDWSDGELVAPVYDLTQKIQKRTELRVVENFEPEKGRLSYNTKDFIKNGAPPGEWSNRLFKAAIDFHEQGFTKEECIYTLSLMTNQYFKGRLDENDLKQISSAFNRRPRYQKRGYPSDSVFTSIRDWIDYELLKIKAVVLPNTMFSELGDYKKIRQTLRLNLDEYHSQTRGMQGRVQFFKESIDDALQEKMDLARLEYQQTLKEELAFRQENDNETVEFVLAATGRKCDLDIAVIKHFMWQVKRKLHGKKVVEHIMPIFYTATQGAGKTEAIKRLISPFEHLIWPLSLKQLTDERSASNLSKNLIGFADEMSKAEKVHAEDLKQTITAEKVSYRVLGTNHVENNIPQNCTFIGASNKGVDSLIYDSTGMRRYWQFNCSTHMDWETINSIDYNSMWRSVDENNDEGYITGEIRERIRKIQRSFTTSEPIDLFLEERSLKPCTNSKPKLIKNTELFADFKLWCQENGHKIVPTSNRFYKSLRTRGYIDRKTNGYDHFMFEENAESKS